MLRLERDVARTIAEVMLLKKSAWRFMEFLSWWK